MDSRLGVIAELRFDARRETALGRGAFDEHFHQLLKLSAAHRTHEANAADARGVEQLGKIEFRGTEVKWDAIEKKVRATDANEQAEIAGAAHGGPQIGPRCVKLSQRTRMLQAIQIAVLKQDVEASNERTGVRSCGRALQIRSPGRN